MLKLFQNQKLVMDGALGTELEDLIPKTSTIQPKSSPLWSGMVLLNDPSLIVDVHYSYLEKAHADLLITLTYQTSYASLKKNTDLSDAGVVDLWDRAVQACADAISKYHATSSTNKPVQIIGSVGPYATYLADGSEYTAEYRGVTKKQLEEYHFPLTNYFVQHDSVPIIGFETIPSFAEFKVIINLMVKILVNSPKKKCFYTAFNFADSERMIDGTRITDVLQYLHHKLETHPILKQYFLGIGLNCLDFNSVASIVDTINAVDDSINLIVYPNYSYFYDDATKLFQAKREPEKWRKLVKTWLAYNNVKVVGGCCSTTPEDILDVRTIIDETTTHS